MSILDSPSELADAKERAAGLDEGQLLEDLRFWSQAVLDAQDAYRQAQERREAAHRQHDEAQQWAGIVATELRRRRDGRT